MRVKKREQPNFPQNAVLSALKSNLMIIVHSAGVKKLTQESYNTMTDSLHLELMKCPFCHHVGFYVNSYYERSVDDGEDSFRLLVKQIICPECGKTHAILPDTIIPYSKYTTHVVHAIVTGDRYAQIIQNVPQETIRWIISMFRRKWKQRLLAENIPLEDSPVSISKQCIKAFNMQFMQNHCGKLIYHSPDHIAQSRGSPV